MDGVADAPTGPAARTTPRLQVLNTTPGAPAVVPATGDRAWMTGTGDQSAYRCAPLVAANLLGWTILCPLDFMAAWNGGPGPGDLIVRGEKGLAGIVSVFGNGVLTIEPGCVLRTDQGIDLLVTGPLNAPRDGIAPMSAVIEADWQPLGLKLSFAFTRPGSVRFRRGEPLCQIIPLARGLAERMTVETRDAVGDPNLAGQRAALRVGEQFTAAEEAGPPPGLQAAWTKIATRPVAAKAEPAAARVDQPTTMLPIRGDEALRTLAGLDIFCEEDFLDAESCAELTACFRRQSGQLIKQSDGNNFFDNRVLWHSNLPPEEHDCIGRMQEARRGIKRRLCHFFNIARPLYSDTIQLVKWEGGQPMHPHADAAFPDGRPHKTAHREYAAIVYLNDDYDGGMLYFPGQNVQIKPRRGLLVAFSGGLSHIHGVTEVTRGVRFTMPSWYTSDARHREPTDI